MCNNELEEGETEEFTRVLLGIRIHSLGIRWYNQQYYTLLCISILGD